MNDATLIQTTRRRFWLCVVSVFLGGLVCGTLVSMYGIRYIYLHHAPPLEKMAERVAVKIQRGFQLDDATREQVRDEVAAMAMSAHEKLAQVNDDTKIILKRHIEAIAALMPDDASRVRWLKEAEQYIPVPPPIPLPPQRSPR